MVWVYERTESLFVAMLMHARLDVSTVTILVSVTTGVDFLTWLLGGFAFPLLTAPLLPLLALYIQMYPHVSQRRSKILGVSNLCPTSADCRTRRVVQFYRAYVLNPKGEKRKSLEARAGANDGFAGHSLGTVPVGQVAPRLHPNPSFGIL